MRNNEALPAHWLPKPTLSSQHTRCSPAVSPLVPRGARETGARWFVLTVRTFARRALRL